MAYRNIKRNKRRTLLAIVSVGLSVMFIVILQGLVNGMMENIIKNSTKNETGHIKITTIDYSKQNFSSVNHIIYEPDEVVKHILKDNYISKHIEIITERIKFPVMLNNKGKNKTGICIAGDIYKEKQLLMLDKCMIEGEYLKGETIIKNRKKYREIIIGEKLAKALDLKIGDSFSLMIHGVDFGIHIPGFYIRGIFKTNLNILDENVFMINLQDAKYILNTNGGTHEILVMLKKPQEAKKIASYINNYLFQKSNYKNLIALDWETTNGWVKMMKQALRIYNLIYIGITFLGAFIITNIILMIVLERKKEIGILKSMGFKKWQILLIFTLEGVILGAVGSISGALCGVLVSWPLSIYGIDFSSSMSNMNYPMDNVIKWSIDFTNVLFSVLLGVGVSLVVSIIPSRHAARMQPTEALRSI